MGGEIGIMYVALRVVGISLVIVQDFWSVSMSQRL